METVFDFLLKNPEYMIFFFGFLVGCIVGRKYL